MALPSTGAISLNNVNQELGKASPYNQVVSLNDADVRALFGIASGAIRMSDGYGKSTFTNSVTFIEAYGTPWYPPAGVTSVRVKMWGGGGGGGHLGSGGGGGFADFFVATTPGVPLYLFVGNGGTSNVDDTEDCEPEIPGNCRHPNNHGTGGEGSGIRRTTTNPLVPLLYAVNAGGGGGGSEADGGGAGQNGSSDGSFAGGQAGVGVYHNYGIPAAPDNPPSSLQFCSGSTCGTVDGFWGGGGGGGWRSGGGGNGTYGGGPWGNGGGGGGGINGYHDPQLDYLSNITFQNGGGIYPGGGTDPYYINIAGSGLPGYGGGPQGSGNKGRIVILY